MAFYLMEKSQHGLKGRPSNASKGRENWIRTTIYVDPALKKAAKERGIVITDAVNDALKKSLALDAKEAK